MAHNCLRGIQKLCCSLCFLCTCALITVVFRYGDDFTINMYGLLLLIMIFLIYVTRRIYQNSQSNQPRSLNMNILEEFGDEMPLETNSRFVTIDDYTQTYVYRNNGGEGNNCAKCLVEFWDGDTVMKIESCSHVFHENCLYNWLRENMSCPVCRVPIDGP